MGQGVFDGVVRECFHAGDTGDGVGGTRRRLKRNKAGGHRERTDLGPVGREGREVWVLADSVLGGEPGEWYQMSRGRIGLASCFRVKF